MFIVCCTPQDHLADGNCQQTRPNTPDNNPRHWVAFFISPKKQSPYPKSGKDHPCATQGCGQAYSQKCTPKQQSTYVAFSRTEWSVHRIRRADSICTSSGAPVATHPDVADANTTANANANTSPCYCLGFCAARAEGCSVEIVSDILCSLKYSTVVEGEKANRSINMARCRLFSQLMASPTDLCPHVSLKELQLAKMRSQRLCHLVQGQAPGRG